MSHARSSVDPMQAPRRLEAEARRRLETDPGDIAARADLGEALLRQDRLDEAMAAYRAVARADPSHSQAHRTLAAITSARGDVKAGQNILGGFFERYPVTGPATKARRPADAGTPALLKIRGFDRTRVLLGSGRNGAVKTKLRGGHFTTKYLLEDARFPINQFTIARGNILRRGIVPAHGAILNTIAEPDIEGSSLDALAAYLADHPGTPVINRPERVGETTRDGNAARLRDVAGLSFPRTERLRFVNASAAKVANAIDAMGFDAPVILREAGTQTGRTVARIDRRADLQRYVAGYPGGVLNGAFYVIAYREILWNGRYFRKLRVFRIDDAYFPVVCHLDTVWNVHGGNRKTVMRGDAALMAEERRFLDDWQAYVGGANADTLERLAGLVGLEFFGIDFTLDAAGRLFVYELNPAMRHSYDHARAFPYKLPHDRAISEAFTAMVDRRLR